MPLDGLGGAHVIVRERGKTGWAAATFRGADGTVQWYACMNVRTVNKESTAWACTCT